MITSAIDLFREEVYERLGTVLSNEGDEGFITKGPGIVKEFYTKHPEIFQSLETKHAESGYTRKKVICDNGKHAVRFMEWSHGSESPIHEHGGRPCFDIVIEGELVITDLKATKIDEEDKYKLEEVKKYTVGSGEFVIVDHREEIEIHIVKSPNGKSKSLHFYPIDHKSVGVYVKGSDGNFKREEYPLPDD